MTHKEYRKLPLVHLIVAGVGWHLSIKLMCRHQVRPPADEALMAVECEQLVEDESSTVEFRALDSEF